MASHVEAQYNSFLADLEKVSKQTTNKKSNNDKKGSTLEDDIQHFFTDILTKLYVKLIKCLKTEIKHNQDKPKNIELEVNMLLIVKSLSSLGYKEEEKGVVGSALHSLGFQSLALTLGLKGNYKEKEQQSIARFQLQVVTYFFHFIPPLPSTWGSTWPRTRLQRRTEG